MRVFALLALLLGDLLPTFVHAAPKKLERVQLFGREYVRLEDWARANAFTLAWRKRSEELVVTSRWAALEFEVDSRKATINGINAWLSFPIARQGVVAYISPLDLQTLVQPVLFPMRNKSGAKIRTICLDPGHGGKDPGEQEGRHQEKKYNLLLAFELREQLKAVGLQATLTRTRDTFVELNERPALARQRGADLFVSLHFNAAYGSGARGVETYCLTPAYASSSNARGEGANTGACLGNRLDDKNALLAYQIQRSLVKNLPVEDRGLRRARYAVLRSGAMPAVLIEGGFMTDPVEGRRIIDPAYRRDLARAIVDGLLAYKRIVERK